MLIAYFLFPMYATDNHNFTWHQLSKVYRHESQSYMSMNSNIYLRA